MRLTGSIRSLVRNANGVPMEDVQIVIVTGPIHSDIAALTASDGSFGFSNLRPGNYVIKAYSSEVVSDDLPVRVLARKTSFVEIWLDTNAVDKENNVVDEIF